MSEKKKKLSVKGTSDENKAQSDYVKNSETPDDIPVPDYDGSDVDDEMGLQTFSSDADSDKSDSGKKKKKGMTKKQKIAIIAIAATLAVLLCVYLFVIHPYMKKKQEEENAPDEPIQLLEGEALAEGGAAFLMFPQIARENTQYVKVENPRINDTFTVIRGNDDDASFYVLEHGKLAPIKGETVLSVILAAGHTVVSQRVEENAQNFAQYGLAPENNPIKVIVETKTGEKSIFYIGNLVPTQGGYYCRVEGRSVVYILSAENISILTGSSESLLNPILGLQVDPTSSQMMDTFVLTKNGQTFVKIDYVENNSDDIVKSSYKMIYPAKYVVNDDNFGADLLTRLGTVAGYMVVKAGDGTSEGSLYKNTDLMAQFGFYDVDNPPFDIYYEYDGVPNYVMFTEAGNDGYYYAYSMIYDMIILVEKSTVDFLEWDLLQFVNPKLFIEYIGDVSSISISGKPVYKDQNDNDVAYDIDKKITYEFDADDELHCKVIDNKNGGIVQQTFIGLDTSNPAHGLYMIALSLYIDGYASEDIQNFKPDAATEYARFTVEFNKPEGKDEAPSPLTYVFYRFGGDCYFTIDGEGDFYVKTATVDKLLKNLIRAAAGQPVEDNPELP